MAEKFKIELDKEGVRSLLRSEKVLKVCSLSASFIRITIPIFINF